jgi:hypothetical protein
MNKFIFPWTEVPKPYGGLDECRFIDGTTAAYTSKYSSSIYTYSLSDDGPVEGYANSRDEAKKKATDALLRKGCIFVSDRFQILK